MSTPLAALLRDKIRQSGPLTVEEYMEACLYHPEFGYYTNGHNFLPAPAAHRSPLTDITAKYPHDFTTAPEITPLFGATLANWLNRTWQSLGSPTPFTLMEAGPGRGTLMLSLLRRLQTAHPACYAAAHPLLIETSSALTELQRETLHTFPQTNWANTPQHTNAPIILIANELLDAFPHSQLIEYEGRIQPRSITLNEAGNLTFTVNRQPLTDITGITEHSPQMRMWLQALPQTLQAALFLDYGAATEGPTGDTLQAIHRHRKVSVFHLPGETDLTTHVNFHNVTQSLSESHPHLQTHTLTHLAPFLMENGLASLALDAGAPHSATESALHRLLHPSQMGTLFKVQCFTPTAP